MTTGTPDYTNPPPSNSRPSALPQQVQNPNSMMTPPPPPPWTQTQKDSEQENLISRLKNLKKSVAVVSPSERDALGGAGQQFGIPSISKEAFVLKVTSLLGPTVYIEQSTQGEMKFYCDIKTEKDIDKLLDTIADAKPDAKSITLPTATLERLKGITSKDGNSTLLKVFNDKATQKFPAGIGAATRPGIQLFAENKNNPQGEPQGLDDYINQRPTPPPIQSPQHSPTGGQQSSPQSLARPGPSGPDSPPASQQRWTRGKSSMEASPQERVNQAEQSMQLRPGETQEAHADRISQERRNDLQRRITEAQDENSSRRQPGL